MTIFKRKNLSFLDEITSFFDQLIQQKNTSLFIIGLVIFFTIFIYPSANIVSIMEARNCSSAREIVESGNWLIPTLNGELRLEKPPLPTWITAVFGQIFGFQNIGILRLPAAIICLFAAFAIYSFTYLMFQSRKLALISSLIFSTTYLVIYMGRQATWDIYAFSFMMIAIYYLSLGWNSMKWKHFLFSGIFIGCSIMSKGPAALYALFLPFLIAYFSIHSLSVLKKSWIYILITAIVAIIFGFSWFFYIANVTTDEASIIFTKESSNWLNYQVKSFYYYYDFPIHSGIWLILMIGAIFHSLVIRKIQLKKAYIFSLIWLIASIVLLSIVPEKKTRYLLPIFFPLSLLVGVFLYDIWKKRKNNFLGIFFYNAHLILLLILAVSLPILSYFFLLKNDKISSIWWLISSLLFLCSGFFLLISIIQKNRLIQFICMIDFMLLLVFCMLIPTNKYLIQNTDYKPVNLAKLNKFKSNNYYCVDEIIRPEIFWGAKHNIIPSTILNEDILSKVPIIVFSSDSIMEKLSSKLNNKYKIQFIDEIDYNFKHKNSKRYNPQLAKHIFLISPIIE